MPKRSDEHMEGRRRQILDGARQAFSKHGYEGATVERLEQEIGLSRGAIFHYYANKFELFSALAQEDQQRGAQQWLEEGFEPLLRRIAAENPDWLGVYLELGRMLRTDPALRAEWMRRADQHDDLLIDRMRELQTQGVIRDDFDPNEIGRFLGVVIDGVVLHVGAGVPIDVEPVIRLVNDALAPRN